MGGGRWRLARAAVAPERLLFWKVRLFFFFFFAFAERRVGKTQENVTSGNGEIQLPTLGGFGGPRGLEGWVMAGSERAGSARGSSPPRLGSERGWPRGRRWIRRRAGVGGRPLRVRIEVREIFFHPRLAVG